LFENTDDSIVRKCHSEAGESKNFCWDYLETLIDEDPRQDDNHEFYRKDNLIHGWIYLVINSEF